MSSHHGRSCASSPPITIVPQDRLLTLSSQGTWPSTRRRLVLDCHHSRKPGKAYYTIFGSCTSSSDTSGTLQTEMAAVAMQMGASLKMDLTSDVTHLIVGQIDTPKYRYTAKERPDIKVLSPSWLEAVRLAWMQGDDVDVARLEHQHRLPTFFGLHICVTGFDDGLRSLPCLCPNTH